MVLRVALAASLLAACGFDADYRGTDYQCQAECPSGQMCIDGACRAGTGDAIDAGGTPDAALNEYAEAVLADEPILYLRLDEEDGDLATDSSGAGRHGSYELGAEHDPDGAVGGAMHTDGVTGRVTVPDDEAMRLNGDFTIELWVKLDATVHSFPGVLSKGGASAEETGFIIYYGDEAKLLTLKRAGQDGIAPVGEPLSLGFRHYALTYDESAETATWYADGDEINVRTGQAWPDNTNTTRLSFGRGDEYGKQWLDEIALYDRALTAERVAAHFDAASD